MNFEKLYNNAIFLKDQVISHRQRTQRQEVETWVGFVIIFATPLLIVSMVTSHKDTLAIMLIMELMFFSYRAVSNSYVRISSEKENRTFSSLVSSLYSPLDILLGYFWSAYKPVITKILLLIPIVFIIGWAIGFNPLLLIITIFFAKIYIILFTGLFTVLGLYFSTTANSSKEARDKSMGTLMAVIYISMVIATLYLYKYWYFSFCHGKPYMLIGNPLLTKTSISFIFMNAFNPITNLIVLSNLHLYTYDQFMPFFYLIFCIFSSFFVLIVIIITFALKTLNKLSEVPGS